jgi:hypothetical protein
MPCWKKIDKVSQAPRVRGEPRPTALSISIERLIRKNKIPAVRIFNFESGDTV